MAVKGLAFNILNLYIYMCDFPVNELDVFYLFSCKSASCVLPIFLRISLFATYLPVNQLVRCLFSSESTRLSVFLCINLLFVNFYVNQLIVCCFSANHLDVCYLFSCESTCCLLFSCKSV